MKFRSFYLIFILLLMSTAVIAEKQIMLILDQPYLEMEMEKTSFVPGDSCSLSLELDTFNLITEAEMRVYITPKEISKNTIFFINTGINKETLLLNEELEVGSNRIITRHVNFQVPEQARTGSYEITARIITPTYKLYKSEQIVINSGEEMIPVVLLGALFLIPAAMIFHKNENKPRKRRKR